MLGRVSVYSFLLKSVRRIRLLLLSIQECCSFLHEFLGLGIHGGIFKVITSLYRSLFLWHFIYLSIYLRNHEEIFTSRRRGRRRRRRLLRKIHISVYVGGNWLCSVYTFRHCHPHAFSFFHPVHHTFSYYTVIHVVFPRRRVPISSKMPSY